MIGIKLKNVSKELLLLKDIPFWTWGLKGEDTFWYPSIKLFRQKEKNNWNELMGIVSDELQGLFGVGIIEGVIVLTTQL